jgi:soluble lytic murein transglycosylase-like protein
MDVSMQRLNQIRFALLVCVLAALSCAPVRAAERVTLRSGSQFDCMHREADGDRIRLYLVPTTRVRNATDPGNYVEVAANAVVSVESIPDPLLVETTTSAAPKTGTPRLAPAEMKQILARAGAAHNVDADLLASVVKAESDGNVLAVSRTGAQGLMQLMPSTASSLGVQNSFVPEQNIGGGTAYLDELLTRYGNNMALALAAYNAGPLAVDRYHGIPPYRETRAYVARVIREFNRRKLAAGAGVTP